MTLHTHTGQHMDAVSGRMKLHIHVAAKLVYMYISMIVAVFNRQTRSLSLLTIHLEFLCPVRAGNPLQYTTSAFISYSSILGICSEKHFLEAYHYNVGCGLKLLAQLDWYFGRSANKINLYTNSGSIAQNTQTHTGHQTY
jgi:hypothetical protein